MITEKQHNYFYKITNNINSRFYYGIRSTNKDIDNDWYHGSGTAIKSSIKQYGKENFSKEIIADYPTRKEASDHERLVVTLEIVNDPLCYNIRTGGDNEYTYKFTPEQRLNLSIILTGKSKSAEHVEKVAALLRGRIVPADQREKMSKSHTGVPLSDSHKKSMSEARTGEKNHFYGKHHTDETKQKISIANSGKKQTEEHRLKNATNRLGVKHLDSTKEKIRNSRKEKSHPNDVKCSVDGVIYNTIAEASRTHNISTQSGFQRFKSVNFPNWIRMENTMEIE